MSANKAKRKSPPPASANKAEGPPGRVVDKRVHGLGSPRAVQSAPVERLRSKLQLSRDVPEAQVIDEAVARIP